jgi:hypothetical protein
MSDERLANSRVGYTVAVNLLTHEEQQMWARSNAMLVANSIIIASIGVSLSSDAIPNITKHLFLFVMAGFGIILCYLWRCLAARTREKSRCWVQSADQLERPMRPTVKTLRYGDELVTHYRTKIGDNPEIKLKGNGKRHEIKAVPGIMSIAFIVLYILIIMYAAVSASVSIGSALGLQLESLWQ